VRKDPAQGFKSMLQAAQGGYAPAAEAVGMLYMVGKGVQQNPVEAAKWWIQAVEAGNPRAITNFGALVRSGQGGVRRTPELFARWTKYAADHNLDPNP
jgi:TPR repeat protein